MVSRYRVNDSYSDNISVKVGVHQGSVLSPLLFIIVLEALSKEFRTGCSWELFYADDLVVSAETPDALREKLLTWKHNFELKGLRVNMGKTKYMASGHNLDVLKDSGRFPCACAEKVSVPTVSCARAAHIGFTMVVQESKANLKKIPPSNTVDVLEPPDRLTPDRALNLRSEMTCSRRLIHSVTLETWSQPVEAVKEQ